MPVLDDPRRERFAQLMASGHGPLGQCYSDAGYKCAKASTASVNASRLSDQPEVAARIREIQARAAAKASLRAADIIEMLLADRQLARSLDQPAAAIRAAELLGKQIGMFVDKKEIKTGNLDDVELGVLDQLRERLVARAVQSVTGADRPGGERPQDRAVLPGDRSAEAGAVSKASPILPSGDEARKTSDVQKRL